MNDEGISIQTMYEGETFSVYRVEDEEGDVGYDVSLFDSITLHFLKDEWNEFLEVMHTLSPED